MHDGAAALVSPREAADMTGVGDDPASSSIGEEPVEGESAPPLGAQAAIPSGKPIRSRQGTDLRLERKPAISSRSPVLRRQRDRAAP